jgi:DNA-binding CsgD family transcriptional regulator
VEKRTRAPIPANAGFILLDMKWNVVYANPEAERILTYPKPPRSCEWSRIPLQKKIFPVLTHYDSAPPAIPHAEFMSGRRKYVSRTFPMTESQTGRPVGAAMAVLLERTGAASCVAAQVSDRFRLTEREGTVVEFLVQGLTNKEIAERMNISPNTVRTFMRMVMLKFGVSTRSAIVGTVFRTLQSPSMS